MKNFQNIKLAIIGLGYVGLPLAVEFGKNYPILGFDINTIRLGQLRQGHNATLKMDDQELAVAMHPSYSSKI